MLSAFSEHLACDTPQYSAMLRLAQLHREQAHLALSVATARPLRCLGVHLFQGPMQERDRLLGRLSLQMSRWLPQSGVTACTQISNNATRCCPGAHGTWLRCRASSQMSCPGRSAQSCGPAAPARAAGPPPETPPCRRRRLLMVPLRPRRHPSRLPQQVRAAHASLPAHRRPAARSIAGCSFNGEEDTP